MYKTLSPSAIGVKVNHLTEALMAAKVGGFVGLEVSAAMIAEEIERNGVEHVLRQFTEIGIRPAAFALPVGWRKDEATWRRDLDALPRLAQAAAAIGITRTFTWVMPCSNDLAMDQNRAFHLDRFKPIATILGNANVSLGLEFIGPRTLRQSRKFPFIYRMEEMLALAREVGDNVGLLVDAWHWYTSGGTIEQLRALRPRDLVYVHVNDAPAGVHVDDQIDHVRELPGATGVIDIAGFLGALRAIGYDGPVTPEPFKKELNDLASDEARLKAVGAAMDKIFVSAAIGES